MREYLVRAAAVLVAMAALFVLARWAVGPGVLGLVTFNRDQDVKMQASSPIEYLGTDARCDSCHAGQVESWRAASHQGVSCESCHGSARDHVDANVSLAIAEPRELCSRCHAALESRPASQPQVDVEEHAGLLVCTACHSPHDPSLGRSAASASPETPSGAAPTPTSPAAVGPAGPPQIPHSLEGRSECTACHGPEGIKPFPASHAGRTSDICLACHQQQ